MFQWLRRRTADQAGPTWLDAARGLPLVITPTEAEISRAMQLSTEEDARKALIEAARVHLIDGTSGLVHALTKPAFTPAAGSPEEAELDQLVAGVLSSPRRTPRRVRAGSPYRGVSVRIPTGLLCVFHGQAYVVSEDGQRMWFHDHGRALERWVLRSAVQLGFGESLRAMHAPVLR